MRFTARSPGKQAIQPSWHSAAFLSAITLLLLLHVALPPLSFPHCLARTHHTHTHTHHTHPLSPPNLPPFTRFHSYEHVEKGRSLCVKLVPSAPMNVLLCMRAFFSLGNVGMGVRDRGGDGREERGRKRGNGSRRAEEQNAVAVPVR